MLRALIDDIKLVVFVFGAIWLYDRSRGGFKAVKLGE